MFIQLSKVSICPDKIEAVDFAPTLATNFKPALTVHLVSGRSVTLEGKCAAEFLAWYEQCATVIHPKSQRIVVAYSNNGNEPHVVEAPPHVEVVFQKEGETDV